MNEESTRLPKSGSLAPKRKERAADTDKIIGDGVTVLNRVSALAKHLGAFGGSGITGSGIGAFLADVAHVPGVQWWMTGGAAIGLHLVMVLADVAAKVLARLDSAVTEARAANKMVAQIIGQFSEIKEQLATGAKVHERYNERLAELEAFKEETERAKKRRRSNPSIPPARSTTEMAVAPPEISPESP